jgi:ubiquitin carboxyl-terminal hydrolase 14
MLIGTAGPLPTAPKEKTVFIEDLPERERLKAAKTTPAGLTNLGNTCYMNSTVQALLAVPEFRDTLTSYSAGGAQSRTDDVDTALTSSLAQLSKQVANAPASVTPMMFLGNLRRAFPQVC